MTRTQKERSLLKQIGFAARLVIIAYSGLLVVSAIWVGVTPVTYLLLILQFIALFMFVSPVPRRGLRPRTRVGLVAAAAFVTIVVINARREVTSPRHGELLSVAGARVVSVGDIVPERDLLAIGSRFLPLIAGLSLSEASDLLPAISMLYDAMGLERDRYTSPLIPSLVGLPLLFDSKVLTFLSQESALSKRAVVFLHGTGGNIGLLCWIISKGANAINADTYCPSLGALGMWGADRGREILRDLLATLSARGKSEIYLVGISAGAVGAAELVHEFESRLRGVALVSGAHPAIRGATLPVLFVYGQKDERFPPQLLAWIAKQSAQKNPAVTIAEVEGDHLLAIKRHEALLAIFAQWLRDVVGETGK